MKKARKHHYLPQAYLAAFTETSTKEGQFHVFDPDNGNCFRTSPKNVAAQRDFNRVDIEGKSHDILEQALSPLEDRMVQACRKINRSETFPGDENFNYIINLMGLIAVRNPKLRASFNQMREQVINIQNRFLVSDRKIFEHHMKRAVEEGYVRENSITFEEMKQFVEKREYEIEFLPEGNLGVEFNALDTLIPLLGKRVWSLFVAPDPGPCFICSDHPVVLSWKESERTEPIGYGLNKTEVFFPLGIRTGFYGVYEGYLPPVVRLKPSNVAKLNRRIAENAERYIFSTFDKFFIWYKGEMREVDCWHNNQIQENKDAL